MKSKIEQIIPFTCRELEKRESKGFSKKEIERLVKAIKQDKERVSWLI